MGKVNWKPVEKGICMRDYGTAKVFQLQAMVNGKRYTDTLGEMSLAEARIIRDTLARNRKLGVPPLTYEEMRREEAEKTAEAKITEAKQRKATLQEEKKRAANTVARLWEESFFPYRLTLRRSARENLSMSGRWTNHLKAHFGEIALDELEKRNFEDFIVKKRAEGDLSDTTLFKCITDLRLAWSYAVEENLVSRPFPGRLVAREMRGDIDNEKKCYLEPEEARELIKTVYERRLESRLDHDVYCFTLLGLSLGLRAGDICKLTKQAIERHIIDRTKNRRARFVHFNFAPIQTMLSERLALYPPETPTQPLFLHKGADGEMKARVEVPKKFYRIISELGFNETDKRKDHPLEKIDFHALRHTFATLAAMRGVDHLTLMRLMGHKTPAMTLRYIEIADAHQARHQEQAMAGIFPEAICGGSSCLDASGIIPEKELDDDSGI